MGNSGVTIAEFLNVALPSPEVDVDVSGKKTEPVTLGDCRPDYKEPLITPADVTKALCVLLAMAPCFGGMENVCEYVSWMRA
jgi:hypothetical protein